MVIAFFRAVLPALAGSSRTHYPKFVAFNAAGGLGRGAGFVLLVFVARNSYEVVAKTAGRDITAVVVAAVIWRIRNAFAKRDAALPAGRKGEWALPCQSQ